MKRIIALTIIIVASLSSFAQKYEFKGIVFKDVVEANNTDANTLYNRALRYASSFNINIVDRESKIVVANGSIELPKLYNTMNIKIEFTIRIETKDGKYRYEFLNCFVISSLLDNSGHYIIDKMPYEDYINDTKYVLMNKKAKQDAILNPMKAQIETLNNIMKTADSW